MKNIRMKKISTKNILKKIFKGKTDSKVKKKVSKKKVVKAKKIMHDGAGKQIRKNLNIAERDQFVWTKVKDRILNADVESLKTFIESRTE